MPLSLEDIGLPDPSGGSFKLSKPVAQKFLLAKKLWEQKYGRVPSDLLASAYRDPERNRRAGGAPKSDHLHGNALDVNRKYLPRFAPLLNQAGFKALGGTYFNPATGKRQSEDNHFFLANSVPVALDKPVANKPAHQPKQPVAKPQVTPSVAPTTEQSTTQPAAQKIRTLDDVFREIDEGKFGESLAQQINQGQQQHLAQVEAHRKPAIDFQAMKDELIADIKQNNQPKTYPGPFNVIKNPAPPSGGYKGPFYVPHEQNFFNDLKTGFGNAITGYQDDAAVKKAGHGWGYNTGDFLANAGAGLVGGFAGGLAGPLGSAVGLVSSTGALAAQRRNQEDRLAGRPENIPRNLAFGAGEGLLNLIPAVKGSRALTQFGKNALIQGGANTALDLTDQATSGQPIDLARTAKSAALGSVLGGGASVLGFKPGSKRQSIDLAEPPKNFGFDIPTQTPNQRMTPSERLRQAGMIPLDDVDYAPVDFGEPKTGPIELYTPKPKKLELPPPSKEPGEILQPSGEPFFRTYDDTGRPVLSRPRGKTPDIVEVRDPYQREAFSVQDGFVVNDAGDKNLGFVETSKGEFVNPPSQPVTDAPVRLYEGDNDTFGLRHIQKDPNKLKRIQDLGYSDVPQFVSDISRNYNRIYEQPNGRVLLVKKNGKAKLAALELRKAPNSEHYSVVTAFDVSESYFNPEKGRRLIWERRDSSVPSGSPEPPLPPVEPKDTGNLRAGAWGRNQPSRSMIALDDPNFNPAKDLPGYRPRIELEQPRPDNLPPGLLGPDGRPYQDRRIELTEQRVPKDLPSLAEAPAKSGPGVLATRDGGEVFTHGRPAEHVASDANTWLDRKLKQDGDQILSFGQALDKVQQLGKAGVLSPEEVRHQQDILREFVGAGREGKAVNLQREEIREGGQKGSEALGKAGLKKREEVAPFAVVNYRLKPSSYVDSLIKLAGSKETALAQIRQTAAKYGITPTTAKTVRATIRAIADQISQHPKGSMELDRVGLLIHNNRSGGQGTVRNYPLQTWKQAVRSENPAFYPEHTAYPNQIHPAFDALETLRKNPNVPPEAQKTVSAILDTPKTSGPQIRKLAKQLEKLPEALRTLCDIFGHSS